MKRKSILSLIMAVVMVTLISINSFAMGIENEERITVKREIPKVTLNTTKIKFIDEELKQLPAFIKEEVRNIGIGDEKQEVIPDAKREYYYSYLSPKSIKRTIIQTRSTSELDQNRVLTSVPRGGTNTISDTHRWKVGVSVKASYEAKSAGLLKAFVNTSLNMELNVSGEYEKTVTKGEERTGTIDGYTGDYNSVLYCGGINYSKYYVECKQIDVYKVYDYNPSTRKFIYAGTTTESRDLETAEVEVPFYHEYSVPTK